MSRLRPSPAMAVAVAALVVAIGGQSAYATATNFLLNTTNTGTAQTTLDASAVAGKGLQITNTNTGSGATALGLNVATGHAPFSVNSTTKVTNLNASLLGGIAPSGFIQGKGSTYGNAVALPNGSVPLTVTVAPNLTAQFKCQSGFAYASIQTANNTPVNSFFWSSETPTTGGYDGSGAYGVAWNSTDGDQGDLAIVSIQQDINNVQSVTNATVGMVYRSSSDDCHFQIQAITTHQ